MGSLARPSPWRWSHLTLLRMLRPKFRTRKAFLLTSSVLSLLGSNWRTGAPSPTTTSRRRAHCTLSSGFVEEWIFRVATASLYALSLYFETVGICDPLGCHLLVLPYFLEITRN